MYNREASKKYREKNREKRNAYCKEWRKNNPEKYKAAKLRDYASRNKEEINRKQRENRKLKPALALWRKAKERARNKNLEFNILPEDIIIPEFCPILDINLVFNNTKWEQNSPTIDRVDNSKGYIKENIKVISYLANTIKNMGKLDDFKKIIRYMEDHFKSTGSI